MTSIRYQIFDSDGVGDYQFFMSHVAITGLNVEQKFENGQWVLTQRDGASEWTARHENHIGAVLKLIAARLDVNL